MIRSLEVLFAPAEFAAMGQRNLSGTACVVFDVLRATSSMVTALANGADSIIPAAEIDEALAIRRQRPEVLLGPVRFGHADRESTLGIEQQFDERKGIDPHLRQRAMLVEMLALRQQVGPREMT